MDQGLGGNTGQQITPESMSQPDAADSIVKMLLFGPTGMPIGAGAGAGAGGTAGASAGLGAEGMAAGTAGFDALGGLTNTGATVTPSPPGAWDFLFPKPQNGFYSGLGSALGVQNPTATSILNTIDRLKASRLHSEGIPGEGESLQMPQLGGVTLPKRRTSGKMF